MEQYRNIFVISFLFILLVRGQNVQSPCPKFFEYRNDETGMYGLVHVYPKERVSSITTNINFTVAARLLTGYLGKIEPLGSSLSLIQQFNNGFPIDYRLHYPVTSPVPRITAITVNNDVICSGPGDFVGGNQYITKVGLQHVLFLKNGGNNFPQPVPDTQNFPSFSFENVNNNLPWNNNYQPVFVINNSQVDVDERFRPQRPFDINTIFYPSQSSVPVSQPPPQTTSRPPSTQRPSTTPPPAVSNNECGVNANLDNVPLIYKGTSYERGEWPWVVAIFKRKDVGLAYTCSGSLISDRHVITAAHCMQSKTTLTSIKDVVVKVGVHNILNWDDDDVAVTRILASATIHESFNSLTLANDILLLTFTRPVTFNTYIKAVCLWSGNTELNFIAGATGVVTGWGVSEIGPEGSGEPRMVRMPIVSNTECRASRPEFHKLTSQKTLCAGDRNGSGPCLGDSGGGLYVRDNGRWKLRGVVSLSLASQNGDMACNLNDYVVFTDAAKYLTWISDNMKT